MIPRRLTARLLPALADTPFGERLLALPFSALWELAAESIG